MKLTKNWAEYYQSMNNYTDFAHLIHNMGQYLSVEYKDIEIFPSHSMKYIYNKYYFHTEKRLKALYENVYIKNKLKTFVGAMWLYCYKNPFVSPSSFYYNKTFKEIMEDVEYFTILYKTIKLKFPIFFIDNLKKYGSIRNSFFETLGERPLYDVIVYRIFGNKLIESSDLLLYEEKFLLFDKFSILFKINKTTKEIKDTLKELINIKEESKEKRER